jgi:putative transcriptional regulator
MNSSLRERFAQLGPIRAVTPALSGSAGIVLLRRGETATVIRPIDAVMALRARGTSMLKAKQAIEDVMASGFAAIRLPSIDNLDTLRSEMAAAGVAAMRIHPRRTIDVRDLRKRLGMTREQFALRYGLSIENLRNWEDGRRPLDSTAVSYLTAIASDPQGIPLPYEIALRA